MEVNGKELQKEHNLNWYDYGARYYDPQVGRWWSVDPLAEKYLNYSVYNYTMANPLRYSDLFGMSAADEIWNNLGKNSPVEYSGSTQWHQDQEDKKEKEEDKNNENPTYVNNLVGNNSNLINNQQDSLDNKVIILVGLGLSVDKAKELINAFQTSNLEIKIAAILNNMSTKTVDNVIMETGRIANCIKWVGRSTILVGSAISVYQGYDSYTKGDLMGVERAGLDLGTGIVSAIIGGVPGALMYGGYLLLMQAPQGNAGYCQPDIFLNDNTNVSIKYKHFIK